jgi:hypothetical protein
VTAAWRVAPVLALVCACGARSAESVADKFVDYYFVEMDQGRSLPLTTGLAHDMIERELRDVASIRKQMGYMPAADRPEVYYKRLGRRTDGAREVLTYDITLKHDRDVTRKHALVAVSRETAGWRVVFYQVADGEAPRLPPG